MKTLIAFLFIISSSAYATSNDDTVCHQNLRYEIVQRLDAHHYEMIVQLPPSFERETPTFLLITKKTTFNGPQHLGIMIRSIGKTKVALKNGFSAMFDTSVECTKGEY